MQTDDNREGIYEGLITCYLADYMDSEEFWEVIDSRIYADHETVIEFIKLVTIDNGFVYAWLDSEKALDLITNCPSYREETTEDREEREYEQDCQKGVLF